MSRYGRKKGCLLMACLLLLAFYFTFALTKRFGTKEKRWPRPPFAGYPPTLIFQRDHLQRIWLWEIASGHYPSRQALPFQLGFETPPNNPALPSRRRPIVHEESPNSISASTTHGIGPKRIYLDIQSHSANIAYPPRPVPGSIADMDIIMEHCDYSQRKYVRDCLEVLRTGAGLDNGKRLRRGSMDDWKYIFLEANETTASPLIVERDRLLEAGITSFPSESPQSSDSSNKKDGERELHLTLPSPIPFRSYPRLSTPCDPNHPRVFHMFWTGPFTDKPYLALLSFLYTQNCGLHVYNYPTDTGACRPQFWMWINPGPAASVPNSSATDDMFDDLRSNPWASPFLHPRFKDVIRFRLWNTTEQLDGVPELKDEWRSLESLFNSGGHVINVPKSQQSGEVQDATDLSSSFKRDDDDPISRTGSKSSASYDRLSVILSDMARFILCHRFGGIYLDVDTLFLRDWEELWGWKGAFAYRWSRLERYNTAVLHLNKGSALGTFLFRTALKNDLDFHPITVSRYLKDAHLEGLLLRVPDALFDPAWLNTEYFQRDRPPQPYFTDFADFFDTPAVGSAAPQALGMDGFFKGAYSYHFHNFWWKPFDPSHNWPDLGPQFAAGEAKAKSSAKVKAAIQEGDRRDLDWSAVLKRTFESYIRGERPNLYGEWISW
ncbi:hypothetical protein K435DRAFT_772530 [Dendrothele bispora CBS 962.96]|uniref:Glycosyltransferase family 32 protein n=1 Tax=Dendrothele bispora (strain CBS 962.96) TaxID=1314807 RepID=A0A4S8MWW7_DENBC|nr:hypothetical protein K435DRAFT_772530 [Dendrothele bispora CBS 962.96]